MQILIPETEEGKSVTVIVQAGETHDWIDSVPSFLREYLVPRIPEDGKQYPVRITWTIGGM